MTKDQALQWLNETDHVLITMHCTASGENMDILNEVFPGFRATGKIMATPVWAAAWLYMIDEVTALEKW